jgi:hypothetical protein
LSIELDILNQVKAYVSGWKGNRLSAHVFVGQYLDEYSKLPEWVRVSTEPTRSGVLAISTHNRVITIKVNYYRKTDGVQSYELSSDFKDYLLSYLPMHSDYWQEWRLIYDDNTTDLDDETYEGCELVFEFYKAQSITCDAIDEDTVYLLSGTGKYLTSGSDKLLIKG